MDFLNLLKMHIVEIVNRMQMKPEISTVYYS